MGLHRAHISLASVHAHDVRIRSHNGAISGHFNVSRSLSLASSNGAVRAKVALFPRSQEDDDLPELPPNPPSDGVPQEGLEGQVKGGKGLGEPTTVHATTTNGAVDLEYVEHPVGQVLYSYAASTNGKVAVTHTSAFEVRSPPPLASFHVWETEWSSAMHRATLKQRRLGAARRLRVRKTRPTLLARGGSGRRRSGLIGRSSGTGTSSGVRCAFFALWCGERLTCVVAVWWAEKGKDDDRKERGETTVRGVNTASAQA